MEFEIDHTRQAPGVILHFAGGTAWVERELLSNERTNSDYASAETRAILWIVKRRARFATSTLSEGAWS